jgi:hypothetical protein
MVGLSVETQMARSSSNSYCESCQVVEHLNTGSPEFLKKSRLIRTFHLMEVTGSS